MLLDLYYQPLAGAMKVFLIGLLVTISFLPGEARVLPHKLPPQAERFSGRTPTETIEDNEHMVFENDVNQEISNMKSLQLLCGDHPKDLLYFYRFHLLTKECYLIGSQGPCASNMIFVVEPGTEALGKCVTNKNTHEQEVSDSALVAEDFKEKSADDFLPATRKKRSIASLSPSKTGCPDGYLFSPFTRTCQKIMTSPFGLISPTPPPVDMQELEKILSLTFDDIFKNIRNAIAEDDKKER